MLTRLGDREGDDCHLSVNTTETQVVFTWPSGNLSCLMSSSTTTGLSGFCLF